MLNRIKIITLSLLLLFIFVSLIPALDVKEGIPSGTNFEKLGKTAKKIEYGLNKYTKDGKEYLSVISDYHAIFDLDVKPIAAVLTDHDNGEKIFSRTVDTIDLNPEDDLTVPHRQWVHSSAKFLGIGQDYIYNNVLTIEKNTDEEFVLSWVMASCEVGNFEEYEGFWYLKKLKPVDGKPRTYVRFYVKTGFNNILPFQELIMGMFTDGETIEVFNSVYRAADKL